MANETQICITGNITAPAELRFTPAGAAVASFTIASTPRTFDKQTNQFKDGDTLFLRCSVWREQAENVAETLDQKGMKVIAQGQLKQRSYETAAGEKRTVVELEVTDIGPALAFATAKVTRTQKGAGNGSQQSRPTAAPQGNAGGWNAPASDPWGTPAGNPSGDWGKLGGQPLDQPPY